MSSRIGYNIHGLSVGNPINQDALIQHLKILKPRATLVMTEVGLARAIKQELPQCHVIYRHTTATGSDDNLYKKQKPADWLAAHADHAQGGLVLYADNEPICANETELGQCVDWIVELLDQAGNQGIALCVGNFGTGHPTDHERYDLLLPMFRALERWHDLSFWGPHEYYEWHDDFAKTIEISTPWQIGRCKFAFDVCDAHNVRRPRTIITELGIAVPGDEQNGGFRSVPNGGEGQYANFIIEAEKIYQPFDVIGLLFCWGNSGGWHQHDVSNAPGFLQRLVDHMEQFGDVGEPVVPSPPPLLTGTKIYQVVKNNLAYRSEARQGENILGLLQINDEVQVKPETQVEDDQFVWLEHNLGWSPRQSIDGSQVFQRAAIR